jgi:hypothetical protein
MRPSNSISFSEEKGKNLSKHAFFLGPGSLGRFIALASHQPGGGAPDLSSLFL